MARKENGSGNVSLRTDGRYSVSIMKDGKRHTTTCSTKAQANKKLKELKEQIIKNDMSSVKRMTVQTYMDNCYIICCANHLSHLLFNSLFCAFSFISLFQLSRLDLFFQSKNPLTYVG